MSLSADLFRKRVLAKGKWQQDKKHVLKHQGMHRPVGKFLRHIIFGMNDGLVSTLALIAALVGASVGQGVILIAGLAGMFAGAISMSLGTYISTKSQLEFYTMEVFREKEDLERMPAVEKSHVRDIYRKKGFAGAELDMVVNRLTSNKKLWLDVLIEEELGLNKDFLDQPVIASVYMFFSFLVGAFIPLAPFFFLTPTAGLPVAIIASLLLLFFIGSGKTYFTGRNWVKSGFEMILVGSVATFVSFYLGEYLSSALALLL